LKLLITGAAGRIGSRFVKQHSQDYEFVLTDIRPPQDEAGHEWHIGNLADAEFVASLTDGIDAVIHLAADARMSAPWMDLIGPNILGSLNVFEAAYDAGVKRLVFASTVNTVTGYPPDQPVRVDWPTRPVTRYGATKCFGESLCHLYSSKGMSCIALRLGWVIDASRVMSDLDDEQHNIFVSYHDVLQVMELALHAPLDYGFRLYNVLGDNSVKRLDIQATIDELGYQPTSGVDMQRNIPEAG